MPAKIDLSRIKKKEFETKSDKQIAKELGCGNGPVRRERKKRDIQVYGRVDLSNLKDEEFETKSDEQIAKEQGCSRTPVAKEREKRDIQVYGRVDLSNLEDEEFETKSDVQIAKEQGCSNTTVGRERKKRKIQVYGQGPGGYGEKSLAARHPELCKEWDYEKNPKGPEMYLPGSSKKVYWKCPKGHPSYKMTPSNRIGQGQGCPYCSSQKICYEDSLAAKYPEISKEWDYEKNGDVTPDQVAPSSGKKRWWECLNGHPSYKATPASRTGRGTGCYICNKGYSAKHLLDFLLQLEKYKDILQPEEYLHLAARENIKGKSLQFLRDYITCGPPEEKEQMIQKLRRSARVEAGEEEYDGQDCAWEYGENNDSDERTDEEFDTVGCDKTIEDGKLFGGDVSPKATAGEVLDMIDEIFPVSDKSLSDYFVDHLVARIWNHAYRSENAALAQVQAFQGREFPTIVKNRFETEYNRTKSIPMPKGYKMRKNGKKVKPRLMQWHIAQKVMDEKAVGNWSGTGSGKTLSAILSAMVIGARTTVIFCPTQVKETWVNAIKESFSGCEIKVEDFNPKWKQSHRRFLIFGYGKIQSVARSKFHAFIERLDQVDLMVVDEIQYVKQRKVYEQDGDREKEEAENEKLISNRRSMVLYIAKIMSDKNANMAILGMSATPVVNNLQEGKSILDIIVAGKGGLEEINTKGKPTRDKCMAMHRQFVHVGTRYMQHPGVEIKIRDDVTVNIDDGPYMENLYEVKRRGWKPTDVANVLTTARIPKILEELRAGTIVYTEHVRGVVSKLRNAIQDDGWRVGSYTGGDKRGDYDGLHRFKRGEIDVLIASKSISTGIDGIQDVCHRIVMNEIPWTAAEFDQITGRVWRSGQEEPVEIVIILSEGTQRTGDPWSMDRVRLNRINYKREIADAVLDGVYPESNLISPQKAFRLMGEWLKDVSEGNVIEPVIREIEIPFIPRDDEERALQRNHGDVSRTNKRWNKMHSSELHEELTADPRIWEIYHTARDAEMKDWSIVPTEYLAGLCKHRPGRVVGDFGCGTAYLAEALKGHCKVHSFDHVAINDDVVACDMRHTPLEDGVLDIAIFSLSLTGINWREYLDEARRTLKIDGFLWIVEPSISKKIYRSDKLRSFETLLKKKGFAPFKITTEGQFTFLCYVKE